MALTAKNLIIKFFLTLMLGVIILPLNVAAAPDFEGVEENSEEYFNLLVELENEAANRTNKTKKLKSFYSILNRILSERGWRKEDLCDEKDLVVNRILREYGSIFVVDEKALPPPVCMFTSAEEVDKFQASARYISAEIAGTRIELQKVAMEALLKARTEALQKGFDITPRDGAEAARRSFGDTLRLWKSRFEPACEYWKKQDKLSAEDIARLKSLPVKQQVGEVLKLEKHGIYFNKSFNNSILYSVAAPGTSQHLSMLALDVNEFENREVRKILARHGWFQTVRNDTPHFTFLGRREEDLGKLGLKEVTTRNGKFWVPNV